MSETRATAFEPTMVPFAGKEDFSRPWDSVDLIALPSEPTDRYLAGFAHSTRCVEAALRLRYEVFNLELDEGLSHSVATGLDRDAFDDRMTHLVLLDLGSHGVVGTYRMQAAGPAHADGGIYSAQEYDLSEMRDYLPESLELGRACLAADHRTFRAIVAIWLGIGAYMNAYALRYVFGCCSLTTQNPDDGWRALKSIRAAGDLHKELYLAALPTHSCGDAARERALDAEQAYRLPKLFRTYIRLGAKVISEPAIDRDFGTVDFLVMMDGKKVKLSQLDVLE